MCLRPGPLYLPTNVALIGFFNYFYTFVQMDPNDVGENLKKAGASIPNVRPGKATAAFIETVSLLPARVPKTNTWKRASKDCRLTQVERCSCDRRVLLSSSSPEPCMSPMLL